MIYIFMIAGIQKRMRLQDDIITFSYVSRRIILRIEYSVDKKEKRRTGKTRHESLVLIKGNCRNWQISPLRMGRWVKHSI